MDNEVAAVVVDGAKLPTKAISSTMVEHRITASTLHLTASEPNFSHPQPLLIVCTTRFLAALGRSACFIFVFLWASSPESDSSFSLPAKKLKKRAMQRLL